VLHKRVILTIRKNDISGRRSFWRMFIGLSMSDRAVARHELRLTFGCRRYFRLVLLSVVVAPVAGASV
jgi:hypothetical protein